MGNFISSDAAVATVAFRQYGKVLHKQVTLGAGIWGMFQDAKDVKAMGSGFYFKTKHRYNERGVGHRAVGGALPTPDTPNFEEGYFEEKALYAIRKADLRTVAKYQGNGSALSNVLRHLVEDNGEVARAELARVCHGDGSGRLVQTAAAGSSATDVTFLKTGGYYKSGALYIREGAYTDFYYSTSQEVDSKILTNITSGSVTDSATVSASSTWTNGAYVMKEDEYATALDTEGQGLHYLIDDGTNHTTVDGLSTSSYEWWKSKVDSASSNRALDPETLAKLLAWQRNKKKGNIRNHCMLSNAGQPLMYWKYMLPSFTTNVVSKPVKFDAGCKLGEAQPFMGVPWKVDDYCPIGEIVIPDWGELHKYVLKPLGKPTAGLAPGGWTWDGTYDAVVEWASMYYNFFATRRNTHIRYKDLTEDFMFL